MRTVNMESRVAELIRSATKVFCEKGFRQTQMADVAKEMNVAPGTLYLYVEGKEALFDLVLRHGVETGSRKLPSKFPIPNPSRQDTLAYIEHVLSKNAQWPRLKQALRTRRTKDSQRELLEIIQELYSLILRNRWGLILLSRSAVDVPGLAEVFLEKLRKQLLTDLAAYFRLRAKSKQLNIPGDFYSSAVYFNETIAWAAMNRMCDPEFRNIPDETIRAVTENALLNALIPKQKVLS